MNKDDLKECRFIDDEMKFYVYDDFVRWSSTYKYMFEKYLSLNGKLFYKWYIYANIDLTLAQKNVIWDYLNGYCDRVELFKYKISNSKQK